ncbi:major facilitator superfamily domain-containing protein [Chaetomium fimeti]|uniref:Major facilitator superfamily domain-containing protein n=1 Tax=Chaetomium fimeti TaxID=1854472 RepID=A0AAE0HPX9_9PEZI|nr:major facilitator superfamily domain-containing protein [Chaetomium fimeti]
MADEKKIAEFSESQLSRSDDEGQEIAWTEAEEKALVRRIDLLVMPLLILGFFALQLDRGNIGNALTDYFLQDVGITQFQFNIGQQLLSAGIVLLEIPSNLILYRVGPAAWIGGQIVAWGLVAAFQAFQKGLGPYLATRLLLGLCEAGFIPAGLFTITRWYKRDETSTRFSAYFIGNMLAGACSGLIAYGILHMRGIGGLAGWQWLFLLEGLFTILIGVLFITLFPRSSGNPVSLLKFRYFSEREAQILQQRVLRDDPTKFQPRRSVSWAEARATFTNWRLLPHILVTLTCLAPATTMGSYAPSLVVSFGFDRLKSNAMVSIGAWCLIITNLLSGSIADKTGRRGPVVFLGIFILWGLTLGNRLLVDSTNGNLRFGVLTAGIAFQATFHAVHGSWLALNARTAGERSITMALFIMSANLSGIIGSQLFQATDAPLYKMGWTVILALISVAVVMSIAANVQYWVLNRVQKRVGEKRYHY